MNENDGKKTVLIVDDSMVMRSMIEDTLLNGGFDVIGQAKDGGEALELYTELNPDLVTLDIVMPREHGIDALKKIIEHDQDARIIVVSGLHQKSLLMEALEVGARDYVIKPFENQELLEAAKKCAR
jgi:two-component system chemotaxis response regulator CheY